MKYHIQRHVVLRNDKNEIIQAGSCYPTAIACMLDLELDQVPNFQLLFWSCVGQRERLSKYFRDRYLDGKTEDECEPHQRENYTHAMGLSMSLWDIVRDQWLASMGYKEDYISDIDKWLAENPGVPYFVSGNSSRGVGHITIYRDGKMIHDPHPSGEGLVDLYTFPYTYLKKI